MDQGFSPLRNRPDLLCGQPILLLNRYQGSFPGVKRLEHEVDQLRLIPCLRTTGATPLLRPYAFMPWTGTNLLSYVCTGYYLINKLTPWSTDHLERLIVSQAVEKITAFYGTQTFLTVSEKPGHISLLWARSIKSTPPPRLISWSSILILTRHLRLGLPNFLFPPVFLHKIPACISPILMRTKMPLCSHSSSFYRPNDTEAYKSWSSSLWSFFQSPLIPILLGPNVFLSTLSPHSSLSVRDQVPHPYTTTGNFLNYFADGGDGLRMWRVVWNALYKQSRKANNG